jgi:plexin A
VLEPTQLVCRTPEEVPPSTDDFGRELRDGRSLVIVRLGHIRVEIGPLEFADAKNIQASAFLHTNLFRMVIVIIFVIGIVASSGLFLCWLFRRRNTQNERTYKRIKQQMEQLESNVRNECKKAFAELQTDMTDMVIEDVGIPFNERSEFMNRLLFRESIDSSILNGYGTAGIYSTRMPMAIVQFESLVYNRHFLFVLVRMVESNSGITASERSTLSSLLISTMSRDMGYCTEVIFTLLSAHIQQLSQNRSTAAMLFRRSDSLVEKLFQHWLCITLFPSLLEPNGPGRQFFLLYKALKYQCEKGPIDSCTGNARYSLSEQKLLRESVDCCPVVLMILPVAGFDQAPVPLRVLDCDTILQVKMKLLDLLYRNTPYSKRMTVDQFDLEWRCPRKGNILLLDDDQPQLKGLKKLHTVSYYGLQTNSLLTMQQRGQHSFTFRSESGGSSDTTCSAWSSAQLIDSNGLPISPLGSCHSVQYYHLTTPTDSNLSSLPSALLSLDKKGHNLQRNNSRQHLFVDDSHLTKNIPEVFLTRMVMCKGTVQQYIDAFLDSITFSSSETRDVPVVLKYVLDFLDIEATRNNITDPLIIHTWKTNAYILRFWMQLLHNPDALFDIQRQSCIDSSLTVIGQTLIDAFSSSTDIPLGKESPSSKLLFAKDIARYRPIATRMFASIKQHPPIDDEKFFEYIRSMSNVSF